MGHSGRPDMYFINLGYILKPLGSFLNRSGHKFVILDAEMGDGIRCQLFIACAAQIDIIWFTGWTGRTGKTGRLLDRKVLDAKSCNFNGREHCSSPKYHFEDLDRPF